MALESLTEIFADVDAIMVDAYGDDNFNALSGLDLWKRVPAVAAGRVHRTSGVFYGAGYSAVRLVDEWGKLFALV